jgi:tRNA threonylcarbamoyladenosine modification (KEOPS) complex  Pcc1 subunit
MHSATLELECRNPEIVKKSLEPDIQNDADTTTIIITKKDKDKNIIIITIKSKKLSYLKAIINSYISLVDSMTRIDKVIKKEE